MWENFKDIAEERIPGDRQLQQGLRIKNATRIRVGHCLPLFPDVLWDEG